jgi:hypothetical protein
MSKSREELFWQKVEKSESCWNWIAARDRLGYGVFWNGEQMCRAHRVAVEYTTGQAPIDHLDHICRNTSCVNPDHLREVSRKQNMENRTNSQVNNTSGYRGVSIHKTSGLWQATVGHRGKQIHLGYFKDVAEAGAVAQAKRNELFTHNEIDRQQQQAS